MRQADKRKQKRKKYWRHVEVEIGMMWPQAKEQLQPPEAEEVKNRFSPRALGRNTALLTLDF